MSAVGGVAVYLDELSGLDTPGNEQRHEVRPQRRQTPARERQQDVTR